MAKKSPDSPSVNGSPKRALQRVVKQRLRETVIATCSRCVDSKLSFKDDEACRLREGFVSDCEVLETILIPTLILGEYVLPPLKSDRQALEESLQQRFEHVIKTAQRSFNSAQPLCPGDPYLNSSGAKMRRDSTGLPYVEANAFLISTILHSYQVGDLLGISESVNKSELQETAAKAIDQILECFIDERGWSYSTPKHPVEIYFTWSVTETLVDVLWSRKDNDIDLLQTAERAEKLEHCLSQIRAVLELLLFGTREKGRQFVFLPKIIRSRKVDVYHALQAFIVLGILETDRYLEMAQTLITLVANSHYIAEQKDYEVEYPITDDEGKIRTTLRDSSILPLILRSIATVFGEYPNNEFRLFTEKARLRDPWSYSILQDRMDELKAKQTSEDLWGPEGKEYEIYYTERIVEALISLYQYCENPHGATRSLKLPHHEISEREEFLTEFKGLSDDLVIDHV